MNNQQNIEIRARLSKEIKVCTGCKSLQPLSNFGIKREQGRRPRYESQCLSCRRLTKQRLYRKFRNKILLYQKNYRATHKEKLSAYFKDHYRKSDRYQSTLQSKAMRLEAKNRPFRLCAKCGHEGAISDFYKFDNGRYDIYCKTCSRERAKTWNKKNPERHNELSKEYYLRHRLAVLIYKKSHRQKNILVERASDKRFYQAHRNKIIEWQKQYRRTNRALLKEKFKNYRKRKPDIMKGIAQRRYGRERGAPGTVTIQGIEARLAYWGYRCWVCGQPYEAIDHVKPLSRGGAQWPANLRPIFRSCNSRKNDKWEGVTALRDLVKG